LAIVEGSNLYFFLYYYRIDYKNPKLPNQNIEPYRSLKCKKVKRVRTKVIISFMRMQLTTATILEIKQLNLNKTWNF